MKYKPTPDQVVDDLGEKFLQAFIGAVSGAREDYAVFRDWKPGWFTTFTDRFTANLLHERIWARLVKDLGDNSQITVIDEEPERNLITAGGKYVMRIKRHSADERIRSYPTRGALDFWSGGKPTLIDLDHANLAIGYIWDRDKRTVKAPVVSFRESLNAIPLWCIELDEVADGSKPIGWQQLEPNAPTLDLSTLLRRDTGSENP